MNGKIIFQLLKNFASPMDGNYDESGAAYRQMVPKELRHDEARRSGNTCDGCKWNGKRYQKCSCCRRNRNMKDNYKEEK